MAYESDPGTVTAIDPGGSYSGPRWSYHYARPQGGWTSSPAVEAYFKRVADNPGVDPGAVLASWDEAYREQAARLGIRADAGSANNILNYVRLQVGELTWAQIGGQGESVTPSGSGALSAPLVDVIAQQRAAAETEYLSRLDPNERPGDSATVFARIDPTGQIYGDVPGAVDSPTFGPGQPAFSPSPMPNPRLGASMAASQGSTSTDYRQGAGMLGGYAGANGLSVFDGFGTYGSLPGGGAAMADSPMAQQSATAGKGILFYLALAAAGYFAWKKWGR